MPKHRIHVPSYCPKPGHCGLKKGPKPHNDYGKDATIYWGRKFKAHRVQREYPVRFSIIKDQFPDWYERWGVRGQGDVGKCVAETAATICTHNLATNPDLVGPNMVSSDLIYAKSNGGKPTIDSGMYPDEARQIMVEGVTLQCKLRGFKFDPTGKTVLTLKEVKKKYPGALKDSLNHPMKDFLNIKTIPDLKQAIWTMGGALLTFQVKNYDSKVFWEGSEEGENHAVTAVGWDDEKIGPDGEKGVIEILNSWTEEFGDRGITEISYKRILELVLQDSEEACLAWIDLDADQPRFFPPTTSRRVTHCFGRAHRNTRGLPARHSSASSSTEEGRTGCFRRSEPRRQHRVTIEPAFPKRKEKSSSSDSDSSSSSSAKKSEAKKSSSSSSSSSSS